MISVTLMLEALVLINLPRPFLHVSWILIRRLFSLALLYLIFIYITWQDGNDLSSQIGSLGITFIDKQIRKVTICFAHQQRYDSLMIIYFQVVKTVKFIRSLITCQVLHFLDFYLKFVSLRTSDNSTQASN